MSSPYVYDTGALIAAERSDRRMWSLHFSILAGEEIPIVPAPILAQVWRGGSRQAQLARLLRGCQVVPLDEPVARTVGALLAVAGSTDIADATVVVEASVREAIVITSDPSDLAALNEGLGVSPLTLLTI